MFQGSVNRLFLNVCLKGKKFMPDMDLSELTEEQQKLAKRMLIAECDSFAKDDEVGCIKDMVMDITLKDYQPE